MTTKQGLIVLLCTMMVITIGLTSLLISSKLYYVAAFIVILSLVVLVLCVKLLKQIK